MPFLILFLLGCILAIPGFGQQNAVIFPPDSVRREVRAIAVEGLLKVDGCLDEAAWQLAVPTTRFFQVEPYQGQPVNFDTEVRVLFNRQFLYVGAFCRDSSGRRSLRTPNFKRDFESQSHDYFGVSIDGFNDRRNAMTFMTNPYGTQRDLLSFDDQLYDTDWDGLWRVRTQRLDSGWIVEMAIPWQTLRYATAGDAWGINFFRNRRRSNELSGWSAFPRAFSALRMEYAGQVKGLQPPPPSPNIRVLPYLLGSFDQFEGSEIGYARQWNQKVGGEVKWAVNPNAVLDLTVNTDFAQADVDRQVNNISRFSVFFPERRQFFLENASLFGAGLTSQEFGGSMRIQPFFSRQIGLAQTPEGVSKPVPIDAGARFVYRSLQRNYGGMAIRQRASAQSPTTDYLVGRYSENVGRQNRVGGLFTVKNSHASPAVSGYANWAGAVDGFFRLSQPLSANVMAIGSTSTNGAGRGFAGYGQFNYKSNQLVAYWNQAVVTADYNAEVGFVSRRDVVATTPGFFFINRGRWLPKFVRGFEPGLFAEIYHRASTGYLQEYRFNANPIWLAFQDGGALGLFVNPSFQRLDEGDERPLGLAVASGKYPYVRYSLMANTDPSKKVSGSLNAETGGYYDGRLHSWSLNARASPVPHLSVGFDYQAFQLVDVGTDRVSQTIRLYSVDSRIALNPRLQLISFFQKNSRNDRDSWNMRLAWEFKPLSFLYLVYNRGAYAGEKQVTERQREQHLIGKISYLKQF